MAYGFNPCKSDPIVMHKTTLLGYVVLSIYVNDNLSIGSNEAGIFATKAYLHRHFATCDL